MEKYKPHSPEFTEPVEPEEITEKGLLKRLMDAGVDPSSWGQDEAKTVKHLVNEVNAGEAGLDTNESGELVRRVVVGRAEVLYVDPEGQTYRLREDRQEFKDGRIRRREDIADMLSEKMKQGEDPDAAMVRGIQEELDIEGDVEALEPLGTEESVLTSPSYPGLSSVYTSIHYRVRLTGEQFRPEGYIEHQDDKDTYFVWDTYDGESDIQQAESAHDVQAPDAHENLMNQLHPEDATEEDRLLIREKFSGLVEKTLEWAAKSGLTIENVRRLGGGFKNPVIMLTTSEGESFVAKGFAEAEALDTTIRAQEVFSRLSERDEVRLIPRSEIMDGVLFSDKAEGMPLKSLLERAPTSPEALAEALEGFRALGATLGYIHESTERVVDHSSESDQDIIDSVLSDRQKLLRHIDELDLQLLVGLDDDQVESLKQSITSLTTPEYVSIIHADAHLDQFFYGEGSLVEIVDYDDIREGDPMADVGRAIASLRDWCRTYEIDHATEIELTRAIALGYQEERRESGLGSGEEMDSMRAVSYEMRLYLIQLKQYGELRSRLAGAANELNLTESQMLEGEKHDVVLGSYLSDEEKVQLGRLRGLAYELREMCQYLIPPAELLEQAA